MSSESDDRDFNPDQDIEQSSPTESPLAQMFRYEVSAIAFVEHFKTTKGFDKPEGI